MEEGSRRKFIVGMVGLSYADKLTSTFTAKNIDFKEWDGIDPVDIDKMYNAAALGNYKPAYIIISSELAEELGIEVTNGLQSRNISLPPNS